VEEKIQDSLLAFVDFFYAVVFGLILAQTFDEIILKDVDPKTLKEISVVDKCSNLLLVSGVFYFLCQDWLHARNFTLRNPYTRYRRFYLEVIIAFVAYGAAISAVKIQASFFFYIFFGMLLGTLWIFLTLKEHPKSKDRRELIIVGIYETLVAVCGLIAYILWYIFSNKVIGLGESLAFIFFSFFFTIGHDILLPQPIGLMGGPRTLLIPRKIVDKIGNYILRPFRKKGG